jgi:serine/threonine protein kinase
VIDVFEENDTVYYVMPYFAGGSLQDYVKMHGVLSEQEAMKCVKQIASALKYMHEEQHICHYDVKPANILLDDKGNAVLIDFGISKNYDAQGQETTATPVGVSDGYAPIEQYQQNVEEFSPVSDVYALGATLYFLLHGKRPVSAVNRANGTALLMSIHLSQGIKDIINASMKISKHERANNVDVFLKEDYFLETTQGTIDTSTTDKSWSSLKKIAGVFFAILIFIFVGLVLPAIVYFGGGWIAKGIYYSIKPIESSMTLRDIYNQELWIYGIVAYLYFAIAEIIRDSDDNDYVFLGAAAALACLCIFFCYILPMSDIAALLYSIIWICIMGGYGIKKIID